MTAAPIDAYLSRLENELQLRGIEDRRIVEEAREHLRDAIEAGQQRGLSLDDAAREALERFGPAETVVAHVTSERDRMITRFAAVLDTVWRRKWWILAPTVLTVIVTSVASYYFLPTRYRSESSIRVTRVAATDRSRARFQEISQSILSRPRLERIISEFGLYQAGRDRAPLDELVDQMRRDISVKVNSDSPGDEVGGFSVSFVSSDPMLAMKITARLAGAFIEENLQQSGNLPEATGQFFDTQINDLRSRIIAYEKTLETLRARNGRQPLSQADLLPYEVLTERYKMLLIQNEDTKIAMELERRQGGEQFRIIDPPALPRRPLGPSRLAVNVVGAFVGLGLGLALVAGRGNTGKTSA